MRQGAGGGPLVIGVGNPYRGDDGAGLAVARRLRECAGPGVTIREASGDGADLLDLFEQTSWVILIDAVASGAAPGTVLRLDAAVEPLPRGFFRYSSHAFGVAEAVELARALGTLPERLVIFGIEGAAFAAGEGLSAAVEQGVERAVGLVLAEG